ncbi:Protein SCO1 -like protein 1, mitochondrial [Capsicum annuum]|nr:Protein SCO1 -like protein 1, mitochondrial [Capsicum annuum]
MGRVECMHTLSIPRGGSEARVMNIRAAKKCIYDKFEIDCGEEVVLARIKVQWFGLDLCNKKELSVVLKVGSGEDKVYVDLIPMSRRAFELCAVLSKTFSVRLYNRGMAKAITTTTRNQQIRYLYHSLSSQQCRSTNPFFHRIHSLSNTSTATKSLPRSPLALRLDRMENGLISYRFLCTSTPTNQSNSGNSSSSGGSQGKSIRGSTNTCIWAMFYVLCFGKSYVLIILGAAVYLDIEIVARFHEAIYIDPVSWMSFFLLVCTGAGLVYYYDREKKRHIEEITNASTSVKEGPSVGKAAIGGPFNLIDHNGKSVTEKDFFGKWTVVYFGFTHCPDICPEELQKLAAAVDKIKEKSGIQIVPVFISVDPERDTVEQVGEYVKEFHPNLIGLTGSPEEIKKTARAYRVYYMKTEEEGSDYLVDHSIVMYVLLDPSYPSMIARVSFDCFFIFNVYKLHSFDFSAK